MTQFLIVGCSALAFAQNSNQINSGPNQLTDFNNAQTTMPEKPKSEVKSSPPDLTFEQMMIQRNIQVSEWFDGLAEGIDLFLVGKKLTRQPNETRVSIESTAYSHETEAVRNEISLGVFPRFPNLEKYWALKFTSYDEKEDRRTVRSNFTRQGNRRTNYGATAAWYRRFGSVRTSFEPRIELQDPLRVSHSLSFESVAELEKYEINPKLEFYASARNGPGWFQAINFNFFLTKKLTFTLINEGDYLDKIRTYRVNNGFSFGHIISRKSTLAYSFMVNSINRPHYHMDGYVASISWNELVYKRIFDYTLTPYVEFLKANNFKGESGGVLNLRLTF